VLDVAWAGFRIRTTIALRQDYYELIVGNACGGEDMLGNWWEQRLGHAVSLDPSFDHPRADLVDRCHCLEPM
jgi:hypothetical protein